jgi:hypothetical protein
MSNETLDQLDYAIAESIDHNAIVTIEADDMDDAIAELIRFDDDDYTICDENDGSRIVHGGPVAAGWSIRVVAA